jgi:EmrB/QacA subfamily drug resistance transporter
MIVLLTDRSVSIMNKVNKMDDKKRNKVLMVLFFGVLMGALDIAIVGPAMPVIREKFGMTERMGSWIFGIYVLFNLIGTPLMAKLSDIFGRRNIYIMDILLFALGSLITATAVPPSLWVLLAGRGMQGLGAGGIFPVASAVIGDTFPTEKRGSALGLIGAVFGIAFLFGPLLGSGILKIASWNWLFLINLPIALIIVVLALRILPNTRPFTTGRFDWVGMGLMAGLLASLAYAINQIETIHFFSSLISPQVWPFLLIFAVCLILLINVERRSPSPLLPPRLFGHRQLTLTYILSAAAGIGEVSMVFIPEMVRKSLNIQDPATAGLMMMPVILAMAVGSPLAGRFLDKSGSKTVILTGTSIMTVGMILMSLLSASMTGFIVSSILIGIGLSALLGAPIRYIMLNESGQADRTVAQGVAALFTSTGQLLSGALVGAIAASSGYPGAFLVIGVLGMVSILLALQLKNRTEELITAKKQNAPPNLAVE